MTTGTVTALNLADTAADLVPGGVASVHIGSGSNVTVTDTAATLDQLSAIDAANGNGLLLYTDITGTAAQLDADATGNVASGVTYIGYGTNVHVQDAATIAQLVDIDVANGYSAVPADGWLDYHAVHDTAADIMLDINGAYPLPPQLDPPPFYTSNVTVTVDDAATLGQLAQINLYNTDLHYTAVHDTVADFEADAGPGGAGYLAHATSHDVLDTSGDLATAFSGSDPAGLTLVQSAGIVDVVDPLNVDANTGTIAPLASTLNLESGQFGNLLGGLSHVAGDDTIQISKVGGEIADLGTLHDIGGNHTLVLGDNAQIGQSGQYTVDLGTSGMTTIHLEGTGDHNVTAHNGVTETFILGAQQDGGSTINGMSIETGLPTGPDKVNVDGGNHSAPFNLAPEANAAAVNANGEWFFGNNTLTYFDSTHPVALTLTLSGVTTVAVDPNDLNHDTFVVAA
jgi:hypothetical protein